MNQKGTYCVKTMPYTLVGHRKSNGTCVHVATCEAK